MTVCVTMTISAVCLHIRYVTEHFVPKTAPSQFHPHFPFQTFFIFSVIIRGVYWNVNRLFYKQWEASFVEVRTFWACKIGKRKLTFGVWHKVNIITWFERELFISRAKIFSSFLVTIMVFKFSLEYLYRWEMSTNRILKYDIWLSS